MTKQTFPVSQKKKRKPKPFWFVNFFSPKRNREDEERASKLMYITEANEKIAKMAFVFRVRMCMCGKHLNKKKCPDTTSVFFNDKKRIFSLQPPKKRTARHAEERTVTQKKKLKKTQDMLHPAPQPNPKLSQSLL